MASYTAYDEVHEAIRFAYSSQEISRFCEQQKSLCIREFKFDPLCTLSIILPSIYSHDSVIGMFRCLFITLKIPLFPMSFRRAPRPRLHFWYRVYPVCFENSSWTDLIINKLSLVGIQLYLKNTRRISTFRAKALRLEWLAGVGQITWNENETDLIVHELISVIELITYWI
jgi:hypothetical protein